MRLRSMTGYGRGEHGNITVEIRSTNHKYCDFVFRIPQEFYVFEPLIRSVLQNNISRGRIEVTINYSPDITINENRVMDILNSIKRIKRISNIKDNIKLSNLISFPGVIESRTKNVNGCSKPLRKALKQAVRKTIIMKEEEGKHISKDILRKTTVLKKIVGKTEKRIPFFIKEYRNNLKKKVVNLLETKKLNEGRLELEIVLLAEKTDIEEEIVKLKSHLKEFARTAMGIEKQVGKKLEFLNQEMQREINTISAKSNDLKISNYVIHFKELIEKIREQTYNLE